MSWTAWAIDSSEVSYDEKAENVLVKNPYWTVRIGKYGGSRVTFSSCRLTPLKPELWAAALDTVQRFVAPAPHPNLVQFLGVVSPIEEDQAPQHESIVMEYLPTSLYDVLHGEGLRLSRREIAFVAIQVLQGLVFLHNKRQGLGVCLTSKKVMLDGSNRVKLRRFGLELVLRSGRAPQQLSSIAQKTVYEIASDISGLSDGSRRGSPPHTVTPSSMSGSSQSGPPTACSSAGESSTFTSFSSMKQDLFAFGVLVLEMCAGQKPTNELFNRISCAKQIDPVFHSVLELTLPLGGVVMEKHQQQQDAVTALDLLEMLVVNEQRRSVEDQHISSASFPSFLHSDRYFAARTTEQVKIKLQERERRENIDLKRLASVEQELIEEQKNFAVIVLQLEQAQKEKQMELDAKQRFQASLAVQEEANRQNVETIERLAAKIEEQEQQIQLMQISLDDERKRVEALQTARASDAEEKQGLLFEILKLKEEKRKLVSQKQEVEAECAAIANKVGSEKAVLEDLEGRLVQAIHRWEEEQRVRKKADRQAEATSRQLLQMEEEWCRYSRVLQQSPTGKRAPDASLSYVLTLKDKEIQDLSRQLQAAFDDQASLRTESTQLEALYHSLCEERGNLLTREEDAQSELQSLTSQLQLCHDEIAGLQQQFQSANSEIASLNARLADFQEELDRREKMKADEEKARKLRQCLTPNCDAPRYLVGPSGYCKDCEEGGGRSGSVVSLLGLKGGKRRHHRRHRSWDDASLVGGSGVRKNARNIPIMKLVSILRGGDKEDTESASGDARAEDTKLQQLLGALKQLSALLKSDESLKDDLPECLVIKSVLTLMHDRSSDLVVQLDCCKCLSVIVFNHDRNRLIVVAEGGVDPVLAAMKKFQLEVKMQEACCVLLTNLAHNCETNRKRILETGGVDAVLQAMQTFPEHCSAQKRCCWALLTLAGSDFMCDNIAMRGGLGAIIAAMLNCPANEDVQYFGSWALVNLLSGTARLRAFARREGVKEVAEAAYACFPEHEGIQEKTLEILRLLE